MDSIDNNEVEKSFLDSWNSVEKTLARYMNPQDLVAMSALITSLRAEGYDKLFRARQSVDALVLSRSKKHGLRPEQASLRFHLYPHSNSLPRETTTLRFGMIVRYREYSGDISQERTEHIVDSVTQNLKTSRTNNAKLVSEIFLEEVKLTHEVRELLSRLAAQPID